MQTSTAPLAKPRPARWTRQEYAAMAESGVFVGRRVQLLDGAIIEMPPMLTPPVRALLTHRGGAVALPWAADPLTVADLLP